MNKINTLVAETGRNIIDLIKFSGFVILLMAEALYYIKNLFSRGREIIRQMYNAGVRTFSVVSIVGMFTGMIMTLQTGIEMQRYHMEDMIGNVVIATLTREMGPFVSSIILIASVGSSMAAELGTMKVSEEIDALELMTISPVRYLVMPRVVALAIMLPVANIYTIVVGVIGGMIVAKSHLNMPFDTFYMHVIESLHFKAYYVGMLKAFIFGLLISSVSCAQGLLATNGAMGVGKATRDSVVGSFLMVLIVGYFITEIFFG